MSLKKPYNSKVNLEKLPDIVLISWHYTNENVPPYPFCGKREIFCGPKLRNDDFKERKFIQTNGRFFDIDEVFSKLNESDRKIDLVYVVLEVNSTCFPKNLSKLKCPKIASVGDTFHLKYPLSSIIQYLKREEFEHVFVIAQPAHMHFFYEAGITHSAFFPRIPPIFEQIDKKTSGVTYVGNKWKTSHLRRSRMVQYLIKKLPKNKIPFHMYNRLSKQNWRKVLGMSGMTVISSLNGQFTPQIHGLLHAGTLCFVDELSSQSFLYNFFKPGEHLVVWRNFADLLEKIIYYHKNPSEAKAIAKAGKLKAEEIFGSIKNMGHTVYDFAFEEKIDKLFLAINDKRCQNKRAENLNFFNARVRLYENIQELHRIHESLNLLSLTEKNLNPSVDLADLPRLKITHAFLSDQIRNESENYFQSVGVNHQIQATLLKKIREMNNYKIGILERLENQEKWRFLVKSISQLLSKNSVLWIFGKLSTRDYELLHKYGFKPYKFNKHSKIKEFSRKIIILFWKLGLFPFPYLTLKPAMETVPNLNVFLKGWQAHISFLY